MNSTKIYVTLKRSTAKGWLYVVAIIIDYLHYFMLSNCSLFCQYKCWCCKLSYNCIKCCFTLNFSAFFFASSVCQIGMPLSLMQFTSSSPSAFKRINIWMSAEKLDVIFHLPGMLLIGVQLMSFVFYLVETSNLIFFFNVVASVKISFGALDL